jgi:hypothetical protein
MTLEGRVILSIVACLSTIWIAYNVVVAPSPLLELSVQTFAERYPAGDPTGKPRVWLNATVTFNGTMASGAVLKFKVYEQGKTEAEAVTLVDPNTGEIVGKECRLMEWEPGRYGALFFWSPEPGPNTTWIVKVTVRYGGYETSTESRLYIASFLCSQPGVE